VLFLFVEKTVEVECVLSVYQPRVKDYFSGIMSELRLQIGQGAF